jgi:hypothetical protein
VVAGNAGSSTNLAHSAPRMVILGNATGSSTTSRSGRRTGYHQWNLNYFTPTAELNAGSVIIDEQPRRGRKQAKRLEIHVPALETSTESRASARHAK